MCLPNFSFMTPSRDNDKQQGEIDTTFITDLIKELGLTQMLGNDKEIFKFMMGSSKLKPECTKSDLKKFDNNFKEFFKVLFDNKNSIDDKYKIFSNLFNFKSKFTYTFILICFILLVVILYVVYSAKASYKRSMFKFCCEKDTLFTRW